MLATADVPCPWRVKGTVMRLLIEQVKDLETSSLDGLRIQHPEGWVQVLPDADLPVVHLLAEGADQEASEALLDRYREQVETIVREHAELEEPVGGETLKLGLKPVRRGRYADAVSPVEDLTALSDDELRERLRSVRREEAQVSYERRLLHGKIDVLRAEVRARLDQGGETARRRGPRGPAGPAHRRAGAQGPAADRGTSSPELELDDDEPAAMSVPADDELPAFDALSDDELAGAGARARAARARGLGAPPGAPRRPRRPARASMSRACSAAMRAAPRRSRAAARTCTASSAASSTRTLRASARSAGRCSRPTSRGRRRP